MPTYKLTYFDARGRGEVIRLMLAQTGQEFEDHRITGADWPSIKSEMPFGQVPVLEVDGKKLAQTVAICNYLASEYGLYGKTSMDRFHIDEIVCLVNDFISATVKVMYEKDETRKAELMKPYKEHECPKYIGFFEKLLKENGTGFFVGDSVTLADIFVFDFLWSLNFRDAGVLKDFPLVQEHQTKIGSLPNIKAYIDNRKPTEN